MNTISRVSRRSFSPPTITTNKLSRSHSSNSLFKEPIVFNSQENKNSVVTLECPNILKEKFISMLTIQNVVTPNEKVIEKLEKSLRVFAQTNKEVRAFVATLDTFMKNDEASVLCIKNQPFSINDERYLDCFTRILLTCLKLDVMSTESLSGQDSAVEVFHADRGLQGANRLKDIFAIVCTENKPNIPLVVLPWKTIRERLLPKTIETLKQTNQYFNDSGFISLTIPILSLDDKSKEYFFFDNRLSPVTGTEGRELKKIHAVIDTLEETHSIELYLQPGETAIVKNLQCLHKRGTKKQQGTMLDHLSRKVIRYDALNPAFSGVEVNFK